LLPPEKQGQELEVTCSLVSAVMATENPLFLGDTAS